MVRLLLKSTLALILFLCVNGAFAQLREFEITQVQNNRVPVFRDHPEMAAVIVQSSLTNLRFDSNLEIVATLGNPNQGEYILIVRPVRQIVSVNATGYQQGRIQVSLTEPRQVVYYKVEPKEVVLSTLPVTIRVTPADARVLVDGQQTDLSKAVPLEPGTHRIRIEKDGFRTIEQEFTASPDRILFEFSMERVQMAMLRIVTNPGHATVLLDGVEMGTSDAGGVLEFFRIPGTYRVGVALSGFVTAERQVTINESGSNVVRIALERNTGTLTLRVTPANAEVRVNQQVVNATQSLTLPPGPHRIEIRSEFHDPYLEDITIIRNQSIERSIALTEHKGTLLFTVAPSTASVRLLDANRREVQTWTGARSIPDLVAGRYSLHVTADGYEAQTVPITIQKDESVQQRVELTLGAASVTVPQTGSQNCDGVTDIDGNCYKTVQIGRQVWMAENLRTSKYRDGTPIPNVRDNTQWSNLTTGAWATYENSAANNAIYGKLYNWFAVADARGLCPAGWHVPSDSEWTMHSTHLGTDPGHKMKSSSGWNNNGNGSNASGFAVLPGGTRYGLGSFSVGTFNDVGSYGYFWSSTQSSAVSAWYRSLGFNYRVLARYDLNKSYGFSVRCLRD